MRKHWKMEDQSSTRAMMNSGTGGDVMCVSDAADGIIFTNLSHQSGDGSGAEHFAVGLAPQFWTYTPMTIGTFQTLCFVNGLHCFLLQSEEGLKFIPVSKCSLIGIIVNVRRVYNGACLYLLDDGSGFADCMGWSNDDNNLFSLPPLVPSPSTSGDEGTPFRVGDLVQVLGKIQCVAVGEVRKVASVRGTNWEIRDCIREVNVNLMQKISPGEKRSWNIESQHWLRSLQFQEKLKSTDSASLDIHNQGDGDETGSIRNGADVLDLLGPDIAQQAMMFDDFPSADDTSGAWRVFGTSCKCQLDYMDSLLYCHCQATLETLDPQFIFQDHLLRTLLQMRDEKNKLGGTGIPFCFEYKAIANDEQIVQVAKQVVSKTEKPALNAQRLVLRTFTALCKDGILYLADEELDTYMLICKENVIEPYIKTIVDSKRLEATYNRKFPLEEKPAYLACVPSERLQFVKRCINAQED